MKGKERIEKFLELQEKNIEFEDISKEIGITSKTLRSFLNRNGYKLENNKYKIKESNEIKQIEFKNVKEQKKESKNGNTKNIKEKNTKKLTPKKDKKINMTVEDMDKLCEVYDWYMQVKDYKSMKPKKISSKKDINIENKDMTNLKNTSIRVDKTTWENFERLCSNSQFSKQEILTQALRDFMNEHKYLL